MNLKKIIILIFCVLFLGAQLTVALCPYSILWGKNWKNEDRPLWPFKRYPMYAQAKEVGDKMIIRELRIILKNGKGIKVDNENLHIMPYGLATLISRSALVLDSTRTPKPSEYQFLNYLNYLLKKYIPQGSTAQIWSKSYELSSNGVKDFDVKWELNGSWRINDNSYNKNLIK